MSQDYTNIKVCCRFRPKNTLELKEEIRDSNPPVNYDNNTVIIEEKKFNFDHVFKEDSTQEDVFNVAALPVMNDMLKGYNCTIFVYGQTGCLDPDTPVRMYDGSLKLARHIRLGDKLMGDDLTPRKVLRLFRGDDRMYKVISLENNTKYRVNSAHILTLYDGKKVVDVKVSDYLDIYSTWKKNYKGVKLCRKTLQLTYENIKLEYDGIGKYNGFLLNGNHRFLLGDDTVTHNSGKTHTMMGSSSDKGLSPRLVEQLFEHIYGTEDNVEFTITVSYIEIYLEKIRDLLNPQKENLKLREGGHHEGIWIEGVTEQYASSYDDVLEIMRNGTANRSVGETRMNQRSSRSHSVFILSLLQRNMTTESRIKSKLVLVDLAGSEKVGKTGATGLLLKQAQYTNKSLTYLGIVIKALTEKAPHIPYRDSKLTRILTDSLGGNSKTCLIVTCSPSSYNLTETVSTLRFGTRVKTIKNKPIKNVEKSVEEYKKLLDDAYRKIELLQRHHGITDETMSNLTDSPSHLQTIQEITDDFQEKIAEKEHEIEVLLIKIAEKENEIKEKVREIRKLRKELALKTEEVIKSAGPSKQYFQKMLESRKEMVAVLETALRNTEETVKSQRNDYDFTIRTLKTQIDALHDALYKPASYVYNKKIVVPVRK